MSKMQLLNLLLFWLFFGFLAAFFAKKRGKNQKIWFVVGLMLGVVGVLLAALLPKWSPRSRRRPPPPKPLPLRQSEAWLKMWYYLDPAHGQQGPFEFPEVIAKWRESSLSESSYVWGEGMPEWKRLGDLPDVLKEINRH